MNDANKDKQEEKPFSRGNTLFLSGICFAAGLFPLLIGLGVISGNVEAGPAGRLFAIAAGLVFILGGIMVVLRDTAGVRNSQEIPATAPRWIRFGESVIGIAIVAAFAMLCSVVAFGPFLSADMTADMTRQMGTLGAAIFRTIMGGFGLAFWYIVMHLVRAKLRGTPARARQRKP